MTIYMNLDFSDINIDIDTIRLYASDFLDYNSTNGYLENIRYLIEKCGIDIHHDNDSCLRWSAYYGHLEIVQYLVEHGADIHACNDEALRFSATEGHLEVVRYLVECGSDIHIQDDYALEWSMKNEEFDCVCYLLQCGADLNVIENVNNYIKDDIKNWIISIKCIQDSCHDLLWKPPNVLMPQNILKRI